MDPLSPTASIIAILQLSNKVLGYLNDVKDASKDRAKCAIEASNLHGLLLSLRFRLEEGSADKPWYTAIRAFAVENGPLDQFKQALELLQTKITEGGRLKKAGEALVWKLKKEEIASILGRMERLKTLIEIALQMDHFKLSQAIKDDLGFVRACIPPIQSRLDIIRQEQDHAKHDKLMAWISPMDFPAQQSDFIGRRQEGTGQWFLDAPEFEGWLRQPKETLLCPGIPGAGKTMISAIAIDHLLKVVQSSSVGVAYVYCNYKAQEEQDATSLLSAILKQLVQAQTSFVEPVERLHQQHASRGTKPSFNEILWALQSVLANYSTVYVVIDALDECRDGDGTRHQFLAKLRDLQAWIDLRLMVTSRFIPEILDKFGEALRLEVQASNEDVKRFVAGQIYRLPKCIQRDSALQDMVQEKIVEAVDGMFLLAQLHTDSLLDKRTTKDVKSTLAKFSRGSSALDNAYKEAIQRIEGQLSGDYERAKKALLWITYAQRPLTTTEICCALAVEPEEEELDPENVPDVEDLVSVCAGLVVVDEGSAIIRLVHYTTQEYFERIGDKWNPSTQLDIASTCLTYLLFSTFRGGSCTSNYEFEERLRQSEFLDYAAKHWGQHILTVQDEVCELACSFLLHSGSVSCATQVMFASGYKYGNYSQEYPRGATGLHLAARFGLSRLAQEHLYRLETEAMIAVNTRDSRGQTPLFLAAEHGHDGMVKLLVDKGADVNAQGGTYGNALQAASKGGHEQVVRLLLDKGANVNAQGGTYGNALQAASEGGHEQIVQLLLDQGADLNAQGGFYGNALHAALEGGHEQIVRLLLDQGANLNAQGGFYGNALQAASKGGHEQVVRLLLDKGANVNAQGGFYGNALHAASEGGHEKVVRLLLDQGADLNAQGGFYGNALQAASEGGHEQIVRLLLDKGADVNSLSGLYGSFLNSLAFKGCTHLLRLVYEQYNASRNISDSHGRTPLQLAARSGQVDAFRYLICLGLDTKTKDAKGDSMLHYASSGESLQILNAVLDEGPIFPPQSGHWNPLHWACRTGNLHVTERLIQEGLRSECVATTQPEGQWSPISIAIFHGNGKMLEDLSASCRSLLGEEADAVRLHGRRHDGYFCDGCFHDIYGPRFCCRTCLNFDYCFMCKPFLDHLHENHEWDCVESDLEPPV